MAGENRKHLHTAQEHLTIYSESGLLLADVDTLDIELQKIKSLGLAAIGQAYWDYRNSEDKLANTQRQKDRNVLMNNFRSAESFMYPGSLRQEEHTLFVLEMADISKWHFMLANQRLTLMMNKKVPVGTIRGWTLMEKQEEEVFCFGDVSVSVVKLRKDMYQALILNPIGQPLQRVGIIRRRKDSQTFAAYYGTSLDASQLLDAADVNLFDSLKLGALGCLVPFYMHKPKVPFRYVPEICNNWIVKNGEIIDSKTQCRVW